MGKIKARYKIHLVICSIPMPNRRLLVFNLRTDADDHILGFTTRWLAGLAPYYDAIDVLTMHAGRMAVPANVTVYSVGREKGYAAPRRLVHFYAILLRLLLTRRYSACFAHMMPLFAALGGVLLTLFRVPTTTWYTHRQRTQQLRWAVYFSRRVVSAVPDSFPIATPKLRVTGHGVDTDFYKPSPPLHVMARVQGGEIVYVARLTAIKQQDKLLNAIVPLDCRLVLVGDIPDGYDDVYKQGLLAQVEKLHLQERVIFTGAQTPEQVRDWYYHAAAAVNLSPPGLFDKAALESMACAVPTIVSNPAFAPITGIHTDLLHIVSSEDVTGLTAKLRDLLALAPEDRRHIGEDLRQAIIAQHSLDRLMKKLVAILETGEMENDNARLR
jgi:glycosyltransferase involved in cell wall biosynthesis